MVNLFFRCVGEPLNHILPPRYAHNGHPRDFPDPPLQISIVRSYQIYLMLHHAIHQTIISIRAAMIAPKPLPALIAGDPQRDAVLGPQLFELGHDAVGDDGGALGVQAVHHRGEKLKLMPHRVRQEIGIDEHGVGWDQGGVVLKEEGGGYLWTRRCYMEKYDWRVKGEVSYISRTISELAAFRLASVSPLFWFFFLQENDRDGEWVSFGLGICARGERFERLKTHNRASRWPIILLTFFGHLAKPTS